MTPWILDTGCPVVSATSLALSTSVAVTSEAFQGLASISLATDGYI